MKAILKGDIIAITGDFGTSRSIENLKRWIDTNGGRYAAKVEEGITHLICSKEHWSKQAPAVQKARRMKSVKIVTYDWLEDSLQQRSHKREGQYLLTKVEKADKKLKAERKAKERKLLKKEVRRFNNGCEAALADLYSGKPKKETSASLAHSYFTKHYKELQRGESEYSSKPAVEAYGATLGGHLTGSGSQESTAEESAVIATTKTSTKSVSVEDGYKSSSPDALRAHKAGKQAAKKQFKAPPALASLQSSKDIAHFKVSPSPFSLSQPAKFKLTPSGPLEASNSASATPASRLPRRPKYFADPIPEELENHHFYVDSTGYPYTIALVRMDIKSNSNERYLVRLFESHAIPHTYACQLRYGRPGQASTSQVLVPIGSPFDVAFAAFRTVFKDKTGWNWEDRMETGKPEPEDTIEDGGRPFTWRKPEAGQPKGVMLKTTLMLGGLPL